MQLTIHTQQREGWRGEEVGVNGKEKGAKQSPLITHHMYICAPCAL